MQVTKRKFELRMEGQTLCKNGILEGFGKKNTFMEKVLLLPLNSNMFFLIAFP